MWWEVRPDEPLLPAGYHAVRLVSRRCCCRDASGCCPVVVETVASRSKQPFLLDVELGSREGAG